MRHHHATERIPVVALRDANLAVAAEVLGVERAIGYVGRRYADDGSLRERVYAVTANSDTQDKGGAHERI
jgi:ABC-type phosphate transport system substrate-binding protein